MDVLAHNRKAWDKEVEGGNRWTLPVSPEEVAAARRGDWEVYLTETKPTPRAWFPDLEGSELLCLASGGGQQGPILAAAGARVTVFDNSPKQLERDRQVAARENLEIATVLGDMADLSAFPDGRFDLVFHPVSNVFAPAVLPVWREAFRVLRPGGYLLAGIVNPLEYIFDVPRLDQGEFIVRFPLPYSDLESMSAEERERAFGPDAPLEFSHSLEEQIGGQLQAGFVLVGLYEDYREEGVVKDYFPSYLATRALKAERS